MTERSSKIYLPLLKKERNTQFLEKAEVEKAHY